MNLGWGGFYLIGGQGAKYRGFLYLSVTTGCRFNSGAAKVSIPITNRAHMAQITPANTYPGLTRKNGAAPGEPEIYQAFFHVKNAR